MPIVKPKEGVVEPSTPSQTGQKCGNLDTPCLGPAPAGGTSRWTEPRTCSVQSSLPSLPELNGDTDHPGAVCGVEDLVVGGNPQTFRFRCVFRADRLPNNTPN